MPVPANPAYTEYDEVDSVEEVDSVSEALPAGLTASPCDIAKTSETLDGFATNSPTPTAAHRTAINTIAGCLLALRADPRPIRNVDIAGFADPSGTEAHNRGLGQRRAEAVRNALVTALNSRTAGSAASFTFRLRSGGETQQIPGGDAANRRVEVSVEIAVSDIVVHASDTDTHEIPSNLGAPGLEHFCCVKTTGDIVLQALIAPNIPGAVGGRLTWGAAGTAITSPAVGTDGRTAKLSSATAGKFPIQLSWDGAVARRAVVWVIWSTFRVTCTRQPSVVPFPRMVGIRAGIDHTFRVDPQQIITDADRPALDGPPTAAVPGAALRHLASGSLLGGGAAKKWDASRQVRVRVLNPRLYPVPQLPPIDPLGHMWNGQPIANTIPENYPANNALGNDDSNTCDETNNPYENCGLVTSIDNPTIPMRNATGADGDTFELRIHFREFLRVNLGTTWYRASDFSLWRFHPRFRRAGGVWTNNASTFAQDNAGF
jgi:outer membrane protein OmpA-like peptidoglycan-associated protein